MRIKKLNRNSIIPCVLTIAGSDSGGGAGIQADLKTLAAIGVHGTTAVTCVTAQNPCAVRSVHAVPPGIVRDQIAVVLEELRPKVIKTGMLYSKAIIEVVREMHTPELPLILDPVMVSTSGALLLQKTAINVLKTLLESAHLITPNLHETEYLLARKMTGPEDLRGAAREFHETYGCAALVKGGHLPKMDVAIDFFYDGHNDWMLEAPFISGVSTHGTGCTYSAAIAGYHALGHSLSDAVALAKEFVSNAIAQSQRSGGHFILNTHWR